ncbi:MAG: glutamine synthetase type III, partial [Cytophagaceae bacterium]
MAYLRFNALDTAQSRQPLAVAAPAERLTEYYGVYTFSKDVMQSLLSREAYLRIAEAIDTGGRIDRDIADEVANAMKSWAVSKGATHFT